MNSIDLAFEVACSPEHAFRVWTERTALWWPQSHTMSQDPELEVHFEPWVGGRIFERSSDGTEFEWGEISVWEPPHRLAYEWHIFFDRSEATSIDLTFEASGGGTRVRLYQRGFEKLPADIGLTRRDRTEGAWDEITTHFRQALIDD